MSEIPKKYTIDNAKNDIKNLQDQNSYDFQEIKRLDALIKDYDKRVLQAINFNNLINKKNQDYYEKIEDIKTEIALILDKIKDLEDNTTSGSDGSGLTITQTNQLNKAYTHSQSYHVSKQEIPTKTSQLTNDSDFVNSSYVDNAISGIDGSGLTISQTNQLNKAYNHSQTKHISQSDVDSTVNNKITESLDGYTLRYLTQNEYDNLSESEKMLNNVEYHITDSEVSSITTVQYSNLSDELKLLFVRIG